VIHHFPPNGSVIQSVAFPPHAKGSIMPRIDIPLDPSLNSIVRPPCAKCDGQMMFTGIVSGPEGVDIRTFECVSCDHLEKVAIKTDAMGWITFSG
jgi:hypothetical protein